MASKRDVDAAGSSMEMDKLLDDKTDGMVQSENIPDHNDPSNKVAMEGNLEENVDPVIALMMRMEKLLKRMEENRTDKVIRVLRSDGQKVSCRMRVNIITIGNIDTVKEEFTCELALTVKWKEPEIGGKDADKINWEELWDPRIRFYNALTINKYEVTKRPDQKSTNSDPIAQLSIRMKGVFKSAMKLNQFPFDYQDLTITIMSDWSSKKTEFLKDENKKDKVREDALTGGQQWELQKHVKAYPVDKKDLTSGADNTYPLYNIVVNVKRKASFYMWNVALIMFLLQLVITGLEVLTYLDSSDASEGRSSVTLAMLLTALGFKYYVSQGLPYTSCPTLLDGYVLWCGVFFCLVILRDAMVPVLIKCIKQFDLITLWIIGVLAGLINIVFTVLACQKSCNVHRKMQRATEEYNSPMNEMSIQGERTPLAC